MGIPVDDLSMDEAEAMPAIVDAMTTRRCGDCSLCCTALEVVELKKPIGVRCEHLDSCGACSIYDKRPKGCRVFYCTWRLAEFLNVRVPDVMKPNACGYVLHWDKGASPLATLFVDPERPNAWTKHKRKLEWFARVNNVAIVIGGGAQCTHFVTPKGNWFARTDYPLYFDTGQGNIGIPSEEFVRPHPFKIHPDVYPQGGKGGPSTRS